MSDFWLWFWRPMAEFLGSIAMVFGLVILVYVLFLLDTFWMWVKKKVKK